MHEMPYTQSIFEIVIDYAKQHNSSKVKKVYLKIGDMTGVIEDSVRFYWESLTVGSVAEGAELIVEHVPIRVRCYNCGTEYVAPDQFSLFCPECNFFGGEMLSGKEMLVESIELE